MMKMAGNLGEKTSNFAPRQPAIAGGNPLFSSLLTSDGFRMGPDMDTLVNSIPLWAQNAKPVDAEAVQFQHDFEMNTRFRNEMVSRQGFSPEVLDFAFEQLTGYKYNRPANRSSARSPTQLGAEVTVGFAPSGLKTLFREKPLFEPVLRAESGEKDDLFFGWELEGPSPLQKMIAKAKEDPDANLFGGGLPPSALIEKFHREIFIPAMAATAKWTTEEILALWQYPDAGALALHRRQIIDKYLGDRERQTIINNFGMDKRHEGLFFTYGSQQALTYMAKMLVDQEKATPESPVELAVTDPVYPGLLMAAKEFLDRGVLKLRVVPIDEAGNLDTHELEEALRNPRCKGFYLSEGNPMPVRFANLSEVAKTFQKPEFQNKLVFEDRAYLGLGATEENSLFDLLPDRVVAFETFSKKGAPFRVGIVYSNMTPDRFRYIRDTLSKYQYNDSLGYSGLLSGITYAILAFDSKTESLHRFTEQHLLDAQAHYEKQRALYAASYKEALDLAFGDGQYDLNDKVVIGNRMFMFGWRKTSVPADLYVKAGAEIKLYSLSGTTCIPKTKDVAGNYDPSRSSSNFRLRQNYTWIGETALRIGVLKDVILEVVFSNLAPELKEAAISRLVARVTEINGGKEKPEIRAFIDQVRQNNWTYQAN